MQTPSYILRNGALGSNAYHEGRSSKSLSASTASKNFGTSFNLGTNMWIPSVDCGEPGIPIDPKELPIAPLFKNKVPIFQNKMIFKASMNKMGFFASSASQQPQQATSGSNSSYGVTKSQTVTQSVSEPPSPRIATNEGVPSPTKLVDNSANSAKQHQKLSGSINRMTQTREKSVQEMKCNKTDSSTQTLSDIGRTENIKEGNEMKTSSNIVVAAELKQEHQEAKRDQPNKFVPSTWITSSSEVDATKTASHATSTISSSPIFSKSRKQIPFMLKSANNRDMTSMQRSSLPHAPAERWTNTKNKVNSLTNFHAKEFCEPTVNEDLNCTDTETATSCSNWDMIPLSKATNLRRSLSNNHRLEDSRLNKLSDHNKSRSLMRVPSSKTMRVPSSSHLSELKSIHPSSRPRTGAGGSMASSYLTKAKNPTRRGICCRRAVERDITYNEDTDLELVSDSSLPWEHQYPIENSLVGKLESDYDDAVTLSTFHARPIQKNATCGEVLGCSYKVNANITPTKQDGSIKSEGYDFWYGGKGSITTMTDIS